ncbi:unnamed protein product [Meganyctiphanes norvegica]|uniref:Sodefrin-like factor n=1 Tax=Meganyctiphanes norvegica TaxID=48144 RepID=A0AAV2SMZ7_MEGNR
MDKHSLVQLICAVGALLVGVQVCTATITCYSCTDGPDIDSGLPFDSHCDDYYYHGFTQYLFGYDACGITIFDNGYVIRGCFGEKDLDDGECIYGDDNSTTCICKTDKCNTESYCSQCGYPRPTPTTTGNPLTSTYATTEPPASLTCYECIGCATVDSSTPVISNASYQSCLTTVFLNSSNVVRGGSYDQHPDGECAEHAETLSCWCLQNLCNNKEFEL